MAKKRTAAPAAKGKAERACIMCNGAGMVCTRCGEAQNTCECYDEEAAGDWTECENCDGHGTPHNIDGSPRATVTPARRAGKGGRKR